MLALTRPVPRNLSRAAGPAAGEACPRPLWVPQSQGLGPPPPDARPGVLRPLLSPGAPTMGAYPPGFVPVVGQSRRPAPGSGQAAEWKGHQIGGPCPQDRGPRPCQRPASVPSRWRL